MLLWWLVSSWKEGRKKEREKKEKRNILTAITMRQVITRIDKHSRVPGSERNPRHNRHDPVNGRHARPREPQLAHRHQDPSDAHNADHGLGRDFARFRIFSVGSDDAANERFEANDEKDTDPNAGEGETGKTEGPVTDIHKDDGIGDEAEVEDGVDDCYVDVPENAVMNVS